MKKHGWKSLVSGVVLTALVMGLSAPALATTGKKQMNVEYVDIKLTVDGVPAPVGTPFISEGTTYLPVRAIGEALYKEVRWDGPTHTIYIDDPTEASTETKSNTVTVDKSKKTIDVDYLDIKLVVDGKEVTPKDVNGKVVEPFAYNGTTYLPVRAVGEALGKSVRWDGETKTVHLGELPQATYLVDVCKTDVYSDGHYVYRAADHEAFVASDGKRYSQGFVLGGNAVFDLGGKYESLTFVADTCDAFTLNIYLDGKLAQEIELTEGMQTVTVPLNYAGTVGFSSPPHNGYNIFHWGDIANAVLSGERAAPAKQQPVPPANATYLADLMDKNDGGVYSDAFGNEYENAVKMDYTTIALNGKYKTLTATAFTKDHNAHATSYYATLALQNIFYPEIERFIVDGNVVAEIKLTDVTPPQTIEIPLNYGMELKIECTINFYLVDAYLE